MIKSIVIFFDKLYSGSIGRVLSIFLILILFISLMASFFKKHVGVSEYNKKSQSAAIVEIDKYTALGRNVLFLAPVGLALVTKNYLLLNEYAYLSLVSFGTSDIIKKTAKKTRPDGSADNSFPSGHALVMFLVAHFVLTRISKRWGYLFYFIAIAIGVSRVLLKKHFVIDVLAGATISIIVVQFLPVLIEKVKKLIK